MQKCDFTCDNANDGLLVMIKRERSKGSVEMGNIIFDYNSKKEFVGIQLMKASSLLADINGVNQKRLLKVLGDFFPANEPPK